MEKDLLLTFLIGLVFIAGYVMIAMEQYFKINKATIALLTAVICWTVQFAKNGDSTTTQMGWFGEHLNMISQVVFFILGALTIVEVMNAHRAFSFLSDYFTVKSKKGFLLLISVITFFMSSVLDNLTTTIVMITLAGSFLKEVQDRWLVGGAIVIAANAGGVWTPIGDVTTTMLWIGGQLSTVSLMENLFLPSILCTIIAIGYLSFKLDGEIDAEYIKTNCSTIQPRAKLVFFVGLGSLIFVPIFKTITGLPPFMGVLLGLSVLWIMTDLIHRNDDRCHLRVPSILSKIDHTTTLFFLGILLVVAALDVAGILRQLARITIEHVPNMNVIAILIGLVSAVVDNVPIVAATMGMFDLNQFPPDSVFWNFIAYCSGTGGSILIVGSAAGIAFMSIESVTFVWYLRNITLPSFLGYFGGILGYLVQLWISGNLSK